MATPEADDGVRLRPKPTPMVIQEHRQVRHHRFGSIGEISPSNNPAGAGAAQETITRLGLEVDRQRAAGEATVDTMFIDDLTADEVRVLSARMTDQPV